MTNLQYDQIFAQRGAQYHAAMRRFPRVRAAEFARAFERRPVRQGQRVLDIPAGGGYVAPLLAGAEVTHLELTAGFGGAVPVVAVDGPWPVGRFDHVLCGAALHHIDDQAGFVARLLEHLEPDGTLHLFDVAVGSPIAAFLDGFVGRHNGTGHAGRYLPADIASVRGGGRVEFCGELACPWLFASRADLRAFCHGLFGLAEVDPAELEAALAELVGIRERDGVVSLDWRLTYVDLRLD